MFKVGDYVWVLFNSLKNEVRFGMITKAFGDPHNPYVIRVSCGLSDVNYDTKHVLGLFDVQSG